MLLHDWLHMSTSKTDRRVFPPEITSCLMVSDESSLSCIMTLTVDVNFTGVGGGGMDRGRGGPIPLDGTSFLGAGIFDTLFTLVLFEGLFESSESCKWN